MIHGLHLAPLRPDTTWLEERLVRTLQRSVELSLKFGNLAARTALMSGHASLFGRLQHSFHFQVTPMNVECSCACNTIEHKRASVEIVCADGVFLKCILCRARTPRHKMPRVQHFWAAPHVSFHHNSRNSAAKYIITKSNSGILAC
jgi:hypothetical protein